MSGITIDVNTKSEKAEQSLASINSRLKNIFQTSKSAKASLEGVDSVNFRSTARLTKEINKNITDFGKNATKSFNATDKGIKNTNTGLSRMTKIMAGLLTTYTGFVSVRAFIGMADDLTLVENRLKLVVKGEEDLIRTKSKLITVSKQSRASFADTANLYTELSRSLRKYDFGEDRLLKVARTIQRAGELSGSSYASLQSGLTQFLQGLGSGELRGQELRAVFEQFRYLGQGLQDQFGMTAGEMIKFAETGGTTTLAVIKAIEKMADKTDEDFGRTVATVSKATQQMAQYVSMSIGSLVKYTGVTDKISKRLLNFGNTFESFSARLLTTMDTAKTGIRNYLRLIQDSSVAFLSFKGALSGGLPFSSEKELVTTLGDVVTHFTRIKALTHEIRLAVDKGYREEIRKAQFEKMLLSSMRQRLKLRKAEEAYVNEERAKGSTKDEIVLRMEAKDNFVKDALPDEVKLKSPLIKIFDELVRYTQIMSRKVSYFVISFIGPLETYLVKIKAAVVRLFLESNASLYQYLLPIGRTLEGIAERMSIFFIDDTRLERSWVKLFKSESLTEFGENLGLVNDRLNTVRMSNYAGIFDAPIAAIYDFNTILVKLGVRLGILPNNLLRTRILFVGLSRIMKNTFSVLGRIYSDVVYPQLVMLGAKIRATVYHVWNFILSIFTESLGEKLGRGLRDLLSAVFSRIHIKVDMKGLFSNSLLDEIKRGILTFLKFVSGFINGFLYKPVIHIDVAVKGIERLKAIFTSILNYATVALDSTISVIKNFTEKVKAAFLDVYDKVIGHSYWPDMIDGINMETNKLTKTEKFLKRFWKQVLTGFKDTGDRIESTALFEWIDKTVKKIEPKKYPIAFEIISWTEGTAKKAYKKTDSLKEKIKESDWFKKVMVAQAEKLDNVLDTLDDKLPQVLDNVTEFGIKVRKTFEKVYDKVVGHSYWPDTMQGVLDSTNILNRALALVEAFGRKSVLIFDNVFKGMSSGMGHLKKVFANISEYVDENATLKNFIKYGYKIVSTLVFVITAAKKGLKGKLLAALSIVGLLAETFPGSAFNSTIKGISEGTNVVIETMVSGFVKSFVTSIKNGVFLLPSIMANAWDGVINGLIPEESMFNKILKMFNIFNNSLIGLTAGFMVGYTFLVKKGWKNIWALFAGTAADPKKGIAAVEGVFAYMSALISRGLSGIFGGTTLGTTSVGLATWFAGLFKHPRIAIAGAAALMTSMLKSISIFEAGFIGIPLLMFSIMGKEGGARALTAFIPVMTGMLNSAFMWTKKHIAKIPFPFNFAIPTIPKSTTLPIIKQLFTNLSANAAAYGASGSTMTLWQAINNSFVLGEGFSMATPVFATIHNFKQAIMAALSITQADINKLKAVWGTAITFITDLGSKFIAAVKGFSIKGALIKMFGANTLAVVTNFLSDMQNFIKLGLQGIGKLFKNPLFTSVALVTAFSSISNAAITTSVSLAKPISLIVRNLMAIGGLTLIITPLTLALGYLSVRLQKISTTSAAFLRLRRGSTLFDHLSAGAAGFARVLSKDFKTIRAFSALMKAAFSSATIASIFNSTIMAMMRIDYAIALMSTSLGNAGKMMSFMLQAFKPFYLAAYIAVDSINLIGYGMLKMATNSLTIAKSMRNTFKGIISSVRLLVSPIVATVDLIGATLLKLALNIGAISFELFMAGLKAVLPLILKMGAIGLTVGGIGALGLMLFGPGDTVIDNLQIVYDKVRGIFGAANAKTSAGRQAQLDKLLNFGRIGDVEYDFTAVLRNIDFTKMDNRDYEVIRASADETNKALKDYYKLFSDQGKLTDNQTQELQTILNRQRTALSRQPQKDLGGFDSRVTDFVNGIERVDNSFFTLIKRMSGWSIDLGRVKYDVSGFSSVYLHLMDIVKRFFNFVVESVYMLGDAMVGLADNLWTATKAATALMAVISGPALFIGLYKGFKSVLASNKIAKLIRGSGAAVAPVTTRATASRLTSTGYRLAAVSSPIAATATAATKFAISFKFLRTILGSVAKVAGRFFWFTFIATTLWDLANLLPGVSEKLEAFGNRLKRILFSWLPSEETVRSMIQKAKDGFPGYRNSNAVYTDEAYRGNSRFSDLTKDAINVGISLRNLERAYESVDIATRGEFDKLFASFDFNWRLAKRMREQGRGSMDEGLWNEEMKRQEEKYRKSLDNLNHAIPDIMEKGFKANNRKAFTEALTTLTADAKEVLKLDFGKDGADFFGDDYDMSYLQERIALINAYKVAIQGAIDLEDRGSIMLYQAEIKRQEELTKAWKERQDSSYFKESRTKYFLDKLDVGIDQMTMRRLSLQNSNLDNLFEKADKAAKAIATTLYWEEDSKFIERVSAYYDTLDNIIQNSKVSFFMNDVNAQLSKIGSEELSIKAYLSLSEQSLVKVRQQIQDVRIAKNLVERMEATPNTINPKEYTAALTALADDLTELKRRTNDGLFDKAFSASSKFSASDKKFNSDPIVLSTVLDFEIPKGLVESKYGELYSQLKMAEKYYTAQLSSEKEASTPNSILLKEYSNKIRGIEKVLSSLESAASRTFDSLSKNFNLDSKKASKLNTDQINQLIIIERMKQKINSVELITPADFIKQQHVLALLEKAHEKISESLDKTYGNQKEKIQSIFDLSLSDLDFAKLSELPGNVMKTFSDLATKVQAEMTYIAENGMTSLGDKFKISDFFRDVKDAAAGLFAYLESKTPKSVNGILSQINDVFKTSLSEQQFWSLGDTVRKDLIDEANVRSQFKMLKEMEDLPDSVQKLVHSNVQLEGVEEIRAFLALVDKMLKEIGGKTAEALTDKLKNGTSNKTPADLLAAAGLSVKDSIFDGAAELRKAGDAIVQSLMSSFAGRQYTTPWAVTTSDFENPIAPYRLPAPRIFQPTNEVDSNLEDMRNKLNTKTDSNQIEIDLLEYAKTGANMFVNGLESMVHYFDPARTDSVWHLAFQDLLNFNDYMRGKRLTMASGAPAGEIGIGGHASGGSIVGPGTGTSDSILARLSNGEFVVNAKATKENRGLLERINNGANLPGFFEGGLASTAMSRRNFLKLSGVAVADVAGNRAKTQINIAKSIYAAAERIARFSGHKRTTQQKLVSSVLEPPKTLAREVIKRIPLTRTQALLPTIIRLPKILGAATGTVGAALTAFEVGSRVGGFANTGINLLTKTLTGRDTAGELLYDLLHPQKFAKGDPVRGLQNIGGEFSFLNPVDAYYDYMKKHAGILSLADTPWKNTQSLMKKRDLPKKLTRPVNGESFPLHTPVPEEDYLKAIKGIINPVVGKHIPTDLRGLNINTVVGDDFSRLTKGIKGVTDEMSKIFGDKVNYNEFGAKGAAYAHNPLIRSTLIPDVTSKSSKNTAAHAAIGFHEIGHMLSNVTGARYDDKATTAALKLAEESRASFIAEEFIRAITGRPDETGALRSAYDTYRSFFANDVKGNIAAHKRLKTILNTPSAGNEERMLSSRVGGRTGNLISKAGNIKDAVGGTLTKAGWRVDILKEAWRNMKEPARSLKTMGAASSDWTFEQFKNTIKNKVMGTEDLKSFSVSALKKLKGFLLNPKKLLSTTFGSAFFDMLLDPKEANAGIDKELLKAMGTYSKTDSFKRGLYGPSAGSIGIGGHASGGSIVGPGTGTSDSILARLSNGEFVVNAKAAAKYRGVLDAINKGAKLPGFRYGGPTERQTEVNTISGYAVRHNARYNTEQYATPDFLRRLSLSGLRALKENMIAFDRIVNNTGLTGADAAKQVDEVVSSLERLKEKAYAVATSKEIGKSSANSFYGSFKGSLKNLMLTGDTKGFGKDILDKLTNGIMDSFIEGFTDNLFEDKGLFDNLFSGLFQGSAGVGKAVAGQPRQGVEDTQEGLTLPIKGLGDTATEEGKIAQKKASWAVGGVFAAMAATAVAKKNPTAGIIVGGLLSIGMAIVGGMAGGSSTQTSTPNLANPQGGNWATGGLITGQGTGTSDSIAAMISNGEYVIKASQTKKFKPLLDAINTNNLSKFATGGPVGSVAMIDPSRTLGTDLRDQNVARNSSSGNQTVVNLNITGDISRQTKAEIYKMLPDISNGVNSYNRQKGYKTA